MSDDRRTLGWPDFPRRATGILPVKLEHTRSPSASWAAERRERGNEDSRLAGSLAGPANEIATCRWQVRERQFLAIAAVAPCCAATGACDGHADHTNTAAEADAAATGPAACAASAASATAATSAATASAREQHAAEGFFIAGEMEGGEVDVGEFFLAERTELAGRIIQSLLRLVCRHRGRHRASRHRKSQSGESERRYRGFGHSLLFRSLLRSLHGRILHGSKNDLLRSSYAEQSTRARFT